MRIDHVFVCSKGKPKPLILDWFHRSRFTKFTFVISNEDDKGAYWENCGMAVSAPKRCDTLYKKKEWVLNEYAAKDEWVFIVEDNILEVTGVKGLPDLDERKSFQYKFSPQDVLCVVNEDIKQAEKIGAVLGGYASNENHFFRTKHYREVGFVWGKMCYFKNVKLPWDHSQREMQDYVHTANVLKHYGRVFINNWLYAKSKRFEGVGGSPAYEARVRGKQLASKYLVEEFDGLFAMNHRPGLAVGSEVKMRMHSVKQIDIWRSKFQTKTYKRT